MSEETAARASANIIGLPNANNPSGRLDAAHGGADTTSSVSGLPNSIGKDPTPIVELEERTVTSTPVNKLPGKRYGKGELNILKFPSNIEERNMPHVLFKIFETQTGAINAPATSPTQQNLGSGLQQIGEAGSEFAAVVNDSTLGIPGAAADAATRFANAMGTKLFGTPDIVGRAKESFKNMSLNRNSEQLSVAVALFMPDGLTTSYDHQYDEISLTATLGGAGMFAQAIGAKDGGSDVIDPFIMEAASKAAGLLPGLQSSQELTSLLVFGTTGRAINPQLEMLYNSPKLRTFTFDFRLVPRNYAEAQEIYGIISTLKYYAAPEIPKGSTGRYFIPPSRFEIEFYHNNELNSNLFKTKQCVLESVTVDYAPNGYASHYDGQPVETRLSLIFRETVIIDKQAVDEGY